MNDLYIMHYGVGHLDGGHSGRYPWGSGDNPRQDEKHLKKMLRSNVRKAERANYGMHGNWFWQGNDAALSFRSGELTNFQKMGKWGRPRYKEAVRSYYNSNAGFRQRVKIAKKAWIDAGKENEKIAKSFIDNYKSNKLAKANGYDFNTSKAKSYIDTYKNKVKTFTNVDDVEFATRYMFDAQMGKHRAFFITNCILAAIRIANAIGAESDR